MIRLSILSSSLVCLALVASLQAQNPALNEGVQLIRDGKFDQALIKLEQAHRIAPRNATIENLLRIADTKLGHIEDANSHYRLAIRLDPAQAAPHRNEVLRRQLQRGASFQPQASAVPSQ